MLRGPGIVAAVIAVTLAAMSTATAATRPQITRVDIAVEGDAIVCTIVTRALFTEQVVNTVESGLPAIVELLYRVLDSRERSLQRGVFAAEIRCDVWNDVYTLVRDDTARTYPTFAAVSAAVEHMERVRVLPLSAATGSGPISVEFAIAVYPLRGKEQEDLVGWVQEQVGGQSSRTWREQVLNIDDLIQRLFSRDAGRRSDWFRSPALTLPGTGGAR